MLTQIVDDIRAAGRPLCAAELSRHLDIDEAALEGMLETLVRRHRLQAIVPDADDCGGCPVRGGCFILSNGLATTYTLPNGPATVGRSAIP
jgi:hypothetical protein